MGYLLLNIWKPILGFFFSVKTTTAKRLVFFLPYVIYINSSIHIFAKFQENLPGLFQGPSRNAATYTMYYRNIKEIVIHIHYAFQSI